MSVIAAVPTPVNASSIAVTQPAINAANSALLGVTNLGTELEVGSTFTALLLSAQQLNSGELPISELTTGLNLVDVIPTAETITEASNLALAEFGEIEPMLSDANKLTDQYQYTTKESITDSILSLAQTVELEQNLSPLIAEVITEESEVEDSNLDSDLDEEDVDVGEVEEQLSLLNLQQPLVKNKSQEEQLEKDFLPSTEAEEIKPTAEFAKEITKKNFDLEDVKKTSSLSQNQEVKISEVLQNSNENNLAPSTAAHLVAAIKVEEVQAGQNIDIVPRKAAPMERLANLKDSLSEQIVMQIERLSDAQVAKQGIRVQLHPKELGEIIVHMRIENDGNTIFEVTSNKASSLQLLQLSNLEDIIQKNINLGDKCTLELGLSQQDLGQGGKQKQQNNSNHPKTEMIKSVEERPLSAISEYYAVVNNAALNISV